MMSSDDSCNNTVRLTNTYKRKNTVLAREVAPFTALRNDYRSRRDILRAQLREFKERMDELDTSPIVGQCAVVWQNRNVLEKECIELADQVKVVENQTRFVQREMAGAKKRRVELTKSLGDVLETEKSLLKEIDDAKQRIDTIENESLCIVCCDTITDNIICMCGRDTGGCRVCIECCEKLEEKSACPVCRRHIEMIEVDGVAMWL